MKLLACIVLLGVAVVAEESVEEKKVDKRGLLGLGYGYGHGYAHNLAVVPAVVTTPAVSYTKVALGHGLGYGHGLYGYGHGLGYGHYGLGYGHGLGYGVGYKTLQYTPAYSYYGLGGYGHGHSHGYYGHGYGHYGYF